MISSYLFLIHNFPSGVVCPEGRFCCLWGVFSTSDRVIIGSLAFSGPPSKKDDLNLLF
jgi:hypothetical protein